MLRTFHEVLTAVSAVLLVGCATMNPNARPLSTLPADLSTCAAEAIPGVGSEYDPVFDSTTAFVGELRLGDAFTTQWRVATQAKHKGRSASDRVAPRLWVNTPEVTSAMRPAFSVLVDDSVRFVWPERGSGFQTVPGLFGEGQQEYHFYLPPANEYARFAAGKKATVAWAHLRQDLNERQLRRFAEMFLWSHCPALHPPPTERGR